MFLVDSSESSGIQKRMEQKNQDHEISEHIKVSVILPVCNPGSGIERCIRSLREQTLREIEMIFVDDCGTDGTMEKIHAAANEDSRIRIIHNEQNSGPVFSRNAGIEAARGEYLQFTDPDDFMDADYLEELYRYACEGKLDLVKGKFVHELADGSQVFKKRVNDRIKKRYPRGGIRFIHF